MSNLKLFPTILMQDITIQKIKDPYCFWGVKAVDIYDDKFKHLREEIKSFFGNEQIYKALLSNPSEGMRCIVRSDTSTWERATIEKLQTAPHCVKARCFLVDQIKSIIVPTSRLYVSPQWIWELKTRGSKFSLHGVVPVTLETNYYTDKVNRRPNSTWSTAAVELFERMIGRSNYVACVENVEITEDGTELVQLYVKDSNMKSLVCVNDVLIARKLAFPQRIENRRSDSEEGVSCSNKFVKNGFSDRNLKDSFKKRMQELEDSLSMITDENNDNLSKNLDATLVDQSSSSSMNSDDRTRRETKWLSNEDRLNDVNNYENDNDYSCIPTLSVKSNDSNHSWDFSTPISGERNNRLNLHSTSIFDCSNAISEQRNNHSNAICKERNNRSNAISEQRNNRSNAISEQRNNRSNAISEERNNRSNPFLTGHSAPLKEQLCQQDSVSSRLSDAGRGKCLSKLLSDFNMKSFSDPPAVQRSVADGNLSVFPNPISNSSHSRIENGSDCFVSESESESDAAILNLKRQLESYELDRITAAKLQDILSMSCGPTPPGRISIRVKKRLLLEKLLNETIERARTLNSKSLPKSERRKPTIELPEHVPASRVAKNEFGQPQSLTASTNGKKRDDEEEKSFFSSGWLLRSQNSSGAILIKGFEPPNPISLFCDAPFPSFLISSMERMGCRGPYCLQAHTWAAILKQRNLIGLAPAQGGKTLAYVAPIVSTLVSRLRDQVDHSLLNRAQATFLLNQSPSVVVLCSTWRNVQTVVDYFKSFLKHVGQESRVVGISGGPEAEKSNSVDLLSGCDVLVCSPYAMIRLFKSNFLSLACLEKLVLDDFHVLAEEFILQIRDIMTFWSEALADPDRPFDPTYKKQILCFGIQWTPGVESFVKNFMTRPLLYITDHLEASVFGQVDHRLKMLKNHFVFDHVISILSSEVSDRSGGVAVFVNSVENMRKVSSALKTSGIAATEAHSNMPDFELQVLQQSLEEASTAPVLVVCDNVLSVIDIDMIEVAIHYDFPADPQLLGLRLGLMRNFFHIKKTDPSQCNPPRSYLLFTEKNIACSVWLLKFLTRLSKPIPALLKTSSEKSLENKEISKTGTLCPFLQAYGRCRDAKVCAYRHWISDKLDAPNSNPKYMKIPTSGHVRVHITSVKNANHFYGRLVRRKSDVTGEPDTSYHDFFSDITNDLEKLYANEKPQLTSLPVLGGLYGMKLFEKFYRVQVVSTAAIKFKNSKHVCWTTPAGLKKTRVHLVDTGSYQKVNVQELLSLPQRMAEIPFQAIEVRPCNLTPIDRDTEWLFSANQLVHDMIYRKDIEGNVVFALNHTIWLQPVLIRSKLPKTGVYVTDCNVISELIQSGLAEKLSNHLENLQSAVIGGNTNPVAENKVRPTFRYAPSVNGDSKASNGDCQPKEVKVVKQSETSSVESALSTNVRKSESASTLASFSAEKKEETGANSAATDLNCGDHVAILSNPAVETNISVTQNDVKNVACTLNGDAAFDDLSLDPNLDELPPLFTPKSTIAPKVKPFHNSVLTSGYVSDLSVKNDVRDRVCSENNSFDLKPNSFKNKKMTKAKGAFRNSIENSSARNRNSAFAQDESDSNAALSEGSPTPTKKSPRRLKKRSPFDQAPKRSVAKPNSLNSSIYSKSSSGSLKKKINQSRMQREASRPENTTKQLSNNCISNSRQDLPPSSDENGPGVIYPFYVQLAHSRNAVERLQVCESIYVQASENHSMVSKIDLESLNKALLLTESDREATLILFTMLTLASCFVPIENFISLSNIIQNFCVQKQPKNLDLPNAVISLTMMLLDLVIEKHSKQLADLSGALISYLDNLTLNFPSNNEANELTKSILQILFSILNFDRKSFTNGDNDRLVGMLSRLALSEETDEIRCQLFDCLTCDSVDGLSNDKDPKESSSGFKSPKYKQKPAKILPQKSDPLNYDRFNNIDTTDSEMSSSSLPYTPIPVHFDFESDVVTETDIDSDYYLPGM